MDEQSMNSTFATPFSKLPEISVALIPLLPVSVNIIFLPSDRRVIKESIKENTRLTIIDEEELRAIVEVLLENHFKIMDPRIQDISLEMMKTGVSMSGSSTTLTYMFFGEVMILEHPVSLGKVDMDVWTIEALSEDELLNLLWKSKDPGLASVRLVSVRMSQGPYVNQLAGTEPSNNSGKDNDLLWVFCALSGSIVLIICGAIFCVKRGKLQSCYCQNVPTQLVMKTSSPTSTNKSSVGIPPENVNEDNFFEELEGGALDGDSIIAPEYASVCGADYASVDGMSTAEWSYNDASIDNSLTKRVRPLFLSDELVNCNNPHPPLVIEEHALDNHKQDGSRSYRSGFGNSTSSSNKTELRGNTTRKQAPRHH